MVSPKTNEQAQPQVRVATAAATESQAACEPEDTVAKQAQIDPAQAEAWIELRDLIQRAKKGDKTTLPRLREYLAKNEFLWRNVGNISVEAQAAWVELTCGDNLYLRECMVHSLNALKGELTGEAASPIEKLLVERVVMGMLQLGYLESREAQQGENELRWAEYQRRRQDQAYKQFMGAASALATLRRLVPQRTVYVPVVQQPAAIGVAPEPAAGCQDSHANGHQMLNGKMNGSGKLNGHNRVGQLLETVRTAHPDK